MGKLGRPTSLEVAQQAAAKAIGHIEWIEGIEGVLIAGSVRRLKPVVQDLDLVIVTKPGFQDLSVYGDYYVGDDRYHWTPKGGVANVDGVRVEMFLAPTHCAGATLQFATGPGDLNVYLRWLAKRRGWMLSQYGLIDEIKSRHDSVTGDPEADEASIFEALEVPYMTPEQRNEWREYK